MGNGLRPQAERRARMMLREMVNKQARASVRHRRGEAAPRPPDVSGSHPPEARRVPRAVGLSAG
eukprot:4385317-Pyramimonas_sp.AAC.1